MALTYQSSFNITVNDAVANRIGEAKCALPFGFSS